MKFRVRGADSITGKDVLCEVEAACQNEAKMMANQRGIFVSEIDPASDPARPPRKRLLGDRRVVVAASAIAVVIPLLAWWISIKDQLFSDSSNRTSNASSTLGRNASQGMTGRTTPSGAGDAQLRGTESQRSVNQRSSGGKNIKDVPLSDLLADMKSPDQQRRLAAAVAMNKITLHTKAEVDMATNALVVALHDKDESTASFAASALIKLGPNGVAYLTVELEADATGDDSSTIPDTVIFELSKCGTKGIDCLIELLACNKNTKAVLACTTLGSMGNPAIPALREATRRFEGENAPRVRGYAVLALGQMGRAAWSAELDIRDRLNDTNSGVRKLAEEALRAVR